MLQNFKEIFLLKDLRRLVLASFLARVVVLIGLPSSPSAFGPDEGTYGYLAKWVSEGKDVTDFPAFGAGLYNTSRSLILPAALLCKLGISELTAVRLTALLYGFASILAFLILMTYVFPKLKRDQNKKIRNLFFVLTIIYAFLPSHLIWSVLGLRESALDFWLILSFLLLLEVKTRRTFQIRNLFLILILILSLGFAFGAQIGRAHV